MRDSFDVVIAGAGPAGAQCARDLAARGYDVVVLETEPEDDFPRQSNKSTGGTFPSMMTSFGIPDDVVMQFTDTVVIESPSDYFVQEQSGAVLEFGEFKTFLVEDGRDRGAEYRFGARVSKPITEGGEAIGVKYDGSEEVYGDVIIDATGPAAPLAKALGVSTLERKHQAIGLEYELEGVDLDGDSRYADLTDAMMLRLDHEFAPGGYSWIFHTGEDTAKVGVCYIQNESYQRYGASRTVDGYLQHWLDTDPRFENAERLEGKQHRGSAHIQPPNRLSTDNFMAIGDTVPTIDPLWGEGINKGMKSARAAAITVDHCLTPDEQDTSADNISLYDTLWHRDVAPRMDARLFITQLLYLAPNDRYDTLLEDLKRLDTETLGEANKGNKLALRKLLHLDDVPLLVEFAKQRLRN